MHRTRKTRHGSRRRLPALLAVAMLVATVLIPTTAPGVGAAPAAPGVLADFEGGAPPGFFAFSGASTVDTTVLTVSESDPSARPDQVGDNSLLQVAFDVSDFGGFGQDVNLANGGPQDWSATGGMSFWFRGTASGLAYQAEISDNRSDPATDTSERFDHTFVDDTVGWRLITIPWSDFDRAVDFQPTGAPDDGLTLTEVWAWAIVLPLGADAVSFDDVALESADRVIDDFESGLPFTSSSNGELLGFYTFQGDGSVSITTTTVPPAPAPEGGTSNNVLLMDVDVSSFAGYIHAFENEVGDTWVTQNWSTSEGIRFWMYGTNSGIDMFIDILDNRSPGSTVDDAERWTVDFVDDFSGWQLLEFPFSSFKRKEIGNTAPNDGLGLFAMHGYALGTLGTGGPQSFYFDDVALYGVAEPPALAAQFANQNTFIEEGTTGNVAVKLNRPMGPEDPAQVSIDFATERANAVAGEEYTPTSGTLTFVNGGPTELSFPVETFDDTKFEGDEQIVVRLTNPVDVERGALFQGSVLIDDNDPFDPNLLDDFTQGAYLWNGQGSADIEAVRTESADAAARPGQDAVELIGAARVPLSVEVDVKGNVCKRGSGVLPVHLLSTASFDATTVDHTTVTFGDATEAHVVRKTGQAKRHASDVDGDGDTDLVFHFRVGDIGVPCGDPVPFNGTTFDGQAVTTGGADAALVRDFPIAQDWTGTEKISLWYHGAGGGQDVVVTLKDNRAPDPGPGGWTLAWADDFDDPAGTPPDPDNWAYELGDTTPDGKNGWGNEELQYYTDDPANAQTDGNGNLVITLTEAEGSQECYYGPCEFESARLLTQNRAEFAYGRIESRLKVPTGGDGLWPAFWSLGTDITYNPWPGAGEIDFMEYVSRLPNEIFGTIHGPGYSGGASFNGIYDFGTSVYDEFHTFTVEWEPNLITWYVDGIQYHQATPADIAPNPWVFDKPFFLLLNFAIGGNFGGPVDPANTYPQEYLVDYVRVYQGPDTAERFETSFVDDVAGWRQVEIPLADFVRSGDQPADAPDDGLTLTDVWGYGLAFPDGNDTGEARLDLVQRVDFPPPPEVVVASPADSGPGSLREALDRVADNGTITLDPSLAGATVPLSAPIVLSRDVTIDASDAPGFALSGGSADRVLIVDAGVTATVSGITITEGFGFQLAGCVLNNGNLTFDAVTVTGCVTTTDSGDFWQGGAGIYNGEGSTLGLVDSTVSDNTSGFAGGGIFTFFGTTVTIDRSTISGNVAADVGGGLRSLGNVTILNSTISGNTASANFHGGAMFITDGTVDLINTTVAGNTSTGGTGDVFVGTFTDASATVNLTNTIIEAGPGSGSACFQGFFGGGAVTLASEGGNLATDGTCNLTGASDLPTTDPLLGPLADNGGPTQTHALGAGSPAIDSALEAGCPDMDQRGVVRPQGAGCDIGSYEAP